MIIVTVTFRDGKITELYTKGHSGYATEGSDIVCAATSSIIQTAILGLNKFAKNYFSYEINEDKPFLHIRIKEDITEVIEEKVQIILETMLLGIDDLAKGYGKYIKLEVK